jgi:hypothetical protein
MEGKLTFEAAHDSERFKNTSTFPGSFFAITNDPNTTNRTTRAVANAILNSSMAVLKAPMSFNLGK